MQEVLQSNKEDRSNGVLPVGGADFTNRDLALFAKSIIRERAKRGCNLLDPNRTHINGGNNHYSLEILAKEVVRIVSWEQGIGASTRHRILEVMPGPTPSEDYVVQEGISDLSPETGMRTNPLGNVTNPVELSVAERLALASTLQAIHSSS